MSHRENEPVLSAVWMNSTAAIGRAARAASNGFAHFLSRAIPEMATLSVGSALLAIDGEDALPPRVVLA
jgi:hypothetical protein